MGGRVQESGMQPSAPYGLDEPALTGGGDRLLVALEEHVLPKLTSIRRRGERRLRVWCLGNTEADGRPGPIDDLPRRLAALIDTMVDPRQWNVSIEVTAPDGLPDDGPWDQDAIIGQYAPDLRCGRPMAVILRDLYERLADDGWLVIVPQEWPQILLSEFVPERYPGSMVYRKALPWESRARAFGLDVPLPRSI